MNSGGASGATRFGAGWWAGGSRRGGTTCRALGGRARTSGCDGLVVLLVERAARCPSSCLRSVRWWPACGGEGHSSVTWEASGCRQWRTGGAIGAVTTLWLRECVETATIRAVAAAASAMT